MVLLFTSAVAGGTAALAWTRAISGASPLPMDCGAAHSLDPTNGALAPTSPQLNSEVEPRLAVNPIGGDNIVAAWIQDRNESGGGGRSNVVAVTFNRGRTWETVLVPGISDCTGGRFSRASDPWLAFGADGVIYLASLVFDELDPSHVLVNVSRDGGRTWGPPYQVSHDAQTVFNDKQQLSAHPRLPGRVYMTWVQRVPFGVDALSTTMFSTSGDYGRTWALPRPIFATPYVVPVATQIAVLPDETLLYLSTVSDFSPLREGLPRLPTLITARRSTDNGLTWSLPVTIATAQRTAPRDPDTGAIFYGGGLLPELDVARDGTAYVVWADHDSGRVVLSKSTDGGRSWSVPVGVAGTGGEVFLANLAVGARGTVAVTHYDFRGNTKEDRNGDGSDDELTTDVWFSCSRDGGTTWTELHLAGPFDLRLAPRTAGYFLGDYTGLDALPRESGNTEGFAAAFAVSPPLSSIGAADVWYAKLLVPGSAR